MKTEATIDTIVGVSGAKSKEESMRTMGIYKHLIENYSHLVISKAKKTIHLYT